MANIPVPAKGGGKYVWTRRGTFGALEDARINGIVAEADKLDREEAAGPLQPREGPPVTIDEDEAPSGPGL